MQGYISPSESRKTQMCTEGSGDSFEVPHNLSPFLRLPLEIRLEIYSYLFPAIFEPIAFTNSPDFYPTAHSGQGSPVYSPLSPIYPSTYSHYSPTYPDFSPTYHVYSPTSPIYAPTSPTFDGASLLTNSNYNPQPPSTPTDSSTDDTASPIDELLPIVEDTLEGDPIHENVWDPGHRLSSGKTVHTSILSVNKQIHDEASHVLYGRSTFTITITLDMLDYGPFDGSLEGGFKVQYLSPWEQLYYHCTPDTQTGRGLYSAELDREKTRNDQVLLDAEFGSLHGALPILYPAERYRHLLRRIRIRFVDSWRTDQIGSPHRSSGTRRLRTGSRTVLAPVLQRLRAFLPKEARIELGPTLSHGNPFKLLVIDEKLVRRVRRALADILKTAYLLTHGPWDYTLKISKTFEKWAPGIGKAVFARCDANRLEETVLQAVFENFQLGTPDGARWGTREGKLVLYYAEYSFSPSSQT
ncbi:hypothetical protein TWF730_004391 [Orbilia blumenaviensis]|uniref:Uncharacterized protein n=1 Tax=Orbilia blumenaviensis TaxID=1796055 RepID=A0AAV9U0N9_9PEZI